MPLPQLQALFDQPERRHLAYLVMMILIVAILTLGFMYLDRGNDVEYFKQRLYMQEQRLNTLEQRLEEANQVIQLQKKVLEHMESMQREMLAIEQFTNQLQQRIDDTELADISIQNALIEMRRIQEQQARELEERKASPKASKKP